MIDAYLVYRIIYRHRHTPMAMGYRGLDPDTSIFLAMTAGYANYRAPLEKQKPRLIRAAR